MATSGIDCEKCGGAGGWCNYCGEADCACPPEGGYSGWRRCDTCNGEGSMEAPEHVDAPVPALEPAQDADANELQHVRGQLAKAQRQLVDQSHVAICAASELERAQGALDAMRELLQATAAVELLGASAPYLRARAGIALARAQLVGGHCKHLQQQSTTNSTTNRQPARVIELAARKAQAQ